MIASLLFSSLLLAADEPVDGSPPAPEAPFVAPQQVEPDPGESFASTCPALRSYPGESWPDRSQEVAQQRPEQLAALEDYLFPPGLDWDDEQRRGVRTDGIVIVHKGDVVYERYDHGYDSQSRHIAWSASKSFTNALAGVALERGLLELDDSICEHVEVGSQESCQVTLRHALEFSTGFQWRETYEGQSPTASSVLAMLYGQGRTDMAAFVTGHPLRDPPGETWMYSSGDTNVASAVLGAVLAPAHGEHYPWKLLFEPIGMGSAVWERDGAGTYVGSSYVYATTRDFARFGWLLLNEGCWEQRRLLPEGWVAASTQVSEPFRKRPMDHGGGAVQGRGFWLNRRVPEAGLDGLPWPNAPEGSFAALGHWRQSIYVLPQAELVIARNGDDRDGSYLHNETLRLALELVGFDASARAEASPWTQPPPDEDEKVSRYRNSLFRLASGFSAQEVCSCLFVMERDEDFCAEWTRVSPDVAKFKADHDARKVRARALGMGRTRARYTGEKTGCTIEE